MLVYYCPRCQARSQTPVCASCGRGLGSQSVRYVWEDSRSPASDPARVGLLLRLSLLAPAVTILVMLAVEYVMGGSAALPGFFASSGIPYAALGLGAAVFAGGMAALALQGRESVQYMLEPRGVLKRTWIEPTRLRCLARMIPYRPRDFQQNAEGKPFLMAHEEYLAWPDARRFRLSPARGRIALYRPYAFLFMTLYLPAGEYAGAADMISAKLKNLR